MEEFKNVDNGLIFCASEMVSELYLLSSTHPVFGRDSDFSKTLVFSGDSHSSEQEKRRGWAGEGERGGRAEAAGKPPADPLGSANNARAPIQTFTMATIQKKGSKNVRLGSRDPYSK